MIAGLQEMVEEDASYTPRRLINDDDCLPKYNATLGYCVFDMPIKIANDTVFDGVVSFKNETHFEEMVYFEEDVRTLKTFVDCWWFCNAVEVLPHVSSCSATTGRI